MNPAILNQDVQDFIRENVHADTSRIRLSKSPFPEVSSRELAEQIDSRKRCEKKLPLWFSTPGIYYPPKISVEQASSETTARFKAALAKGKTLLDLTGGFGVDSYYFEKAGMQVLHSETNQELSEIAEHNAKILKATNIGFNKGNGLELISSGKHYDTIYIDPSRRVNTQKVFKLRDCEPDVPGNLDLLKRSSSRVIIKTSPLLDIQAGLLELGNVNQVYILSVKNDCKELLWIIDGDQVSEPEIICHTFDDEEHEYRFKISGEKAFTINHYSEPLSYLYEPDVALLKGGAFKLISRDYEVMKLNQNSHLYTSDELKSNFAGRKFEIEKWGDYKAFMKSNKLQKANIISRNFPLTPEGIKKKHKLKDGGNDFLIFTTGPSGELLAIHCRKI